MHPFQKLDLSAARRVITFGDVHGSLDVLVRSLADIGYDDKKGDVLIGLGDWLDRGPAVLEIRDWINSRRPGTLFWVRGNHEQIALEGLKDARGEAGSLHVRNGGLWVLDYLDENCRPSEEILQFARQINQAPAVIEALTPSGRRVGFAHADLPAHNWNTVRELLEDPGATARAQDITMWQRDRFRNARNGERVGVSHIDHVFFGHTIVPEIMTFQNCSWIDTGAYKTQRLSVIDVDQFVRDTHALS